MNGSRIVKRDVDLEDSDQVQPISPMEIYNLAYANAPGSYQLCEEDHNSCRKQFQFRWLRDEECLASVVCPEMTGNVCGEYYLSVEVNNTWSWICDKNEVVQKVLRRNEDISLWVKHNADATFGVNCFLWCTENGVVPVYDEEDQADPSLVQKLVRLLLC